VRGLVFLLGWWSCRELLSTGSWGRERIHLVRSGCSASWRVIGMGEVTEDDYEGESCLQCVLGGQGKDRVSHF
jgi:hypothetical protein